MQRLLLVAPLALLCLSTVGARADVVPAPPDDCVDGTTPATCHGGAHCRPNACTEASGCGNGFVCETVRVCTGEISCVGGWVPPEPPPLTKIVRGACTTECATCEDLQLCVPRAIAEPDDEAEGGGCHAAGGPVGLAFIVAALGVLALAQHLPRRRAFSLLALAAMLGAVGPAAADEHPMAGWLAALARLDVDTTALADAEVTFVADGEPGVLPDGDVQLPRAWLATPDAPHVVARLAHLARHLTLGLPAADAEVGSVACASWQVSMLAHELDGLAVESRVAHALGAPLAPSTLAAHIAARVTTYEARCAGALAP